MVYSLISKNLYSNHSNNHSINLSKNHSNNMDKINLPKEVLPKDSFKTLPAKEKEEYIGNLLKRVLELNPDGITISQIREATDLTYSTIWHHLEILSCTAQAHKISRGNLDVYYHNGIANHLSEHTDGEVRYTISTVKNKKGDFVCIHEKRENRLGNHTVCSGIELPVKLIDNIVTELNKVKKFVKK